MTDPGWRAPILAAAATFAAAACFHHPRDWNSAARLTQAYALGQMGRLDSTPYLSPAAEALGPAAARRFRADELLPEHPPTRDGAFVGGRFWSDKAPGQSLLAAAAVPLARAFGAPAHPVPTRERPVDPAALSLFPTDYWLTLLSSGLCAAALAALFCRALQTGGASAGTATAAALACVAATPLFPYATLCYGHLAAAWWLALAAWLLHSETPTTRRAVLAGLAAGFAVATEYTLAPVAGIAALSVARQPRRALAFVAGGMPVALALGGYHFLITGDALTPAYRYEFHAEFAALHGRSSVPLGMPSGEALRELLIGWRRGLCWHALPVWAAAPGLCWLARRRPALAWICGAGFAALLLTVAAFPKWDGGLAAGPRFLVPGLPLLLWPAALWATTAAAPIWRQLWWISAAAVALGIASLNAAGARVPPGTTSWDFVRHALAANGERHAGHWLLGPNASAGAALAVLLAMLAAFASVAILAAAWPNGTWLSRRR